MPQVPVVQGNSVQIAARQVGAVRPVQLDNALGEGLQNAGRALGQAAEQEDQIQEIYAQAAILDEDNKFAVKAGENATEFANLKGSTPAQEMEERLAGLDLQRRFAVDNAPKRARARIKRSLDVRYENARLSMQRHADVEMFQFRDSGLVSGIDIAAKEAVLGYGTDQFDLNLSIAKLRLQERGALNSWHPDKIAAETAKMNAGVKFDTVVAVAANGEPSAALEQAEAWKDEFEPEQYSRLNNILRPRVDAKWAEGVAAELVDTAEPTSAAPEATGGRAISFAEPLGGRGQTVGGGQYGAKRSYGAHSGQDYAAPIGTPVNPTAAGKVVFAGKKGGYGNRIEIDHGGGYVTSYSHLNDIQVKVGDTVDGRAVIGGVGNTGASKGAHLHYEVLQNGKKVKPSSGDRQGDGSASAALDPSIDPEAAEARARDYISKNPMSEARADALIDAARDRAGKNLQRRNFVEQEEERQFNEIIVEKGIDLDQITDESQIPADAIAGTSPSFQMRLGQTIAGNRERVAKERAAAVEAAQLQAAVMAGGAIDYGDGKTKKAADSLYAQQLAARGQMNPQELMKFNTEFATRIGFAPPALIGQLRGQLRNPDPQMQIAAAATIAEMRARNPALLADFSEEQITRAEQINQYRRWGVSAADAVARVAETERLSKSDQDGRKSQFSSLAKKAGEATDYLEDQFDAPPSPALIGEFNGIWEREFVRTGDIELARATAFASLRRTWGVSRVNGSEQVMKNPPELHYGRIDRGAADAEWIRDQAFNELYGGGVSMPNAKQRFQIKPWNRTINGQPVYIGTLQQADGTIAVAVDERGRPKLYQPDYNQSAAAKRIRTERSQGVQRARDQRSGKRAPQANPGFKL